MAIMEITEKVSKEAYELGDGLANFALNIRKALKDGWQPGQDIPVILAAAMADLAPAVAGLDQLGTEKEENIEAFITAFMLSGKKLAAGFLKP